MNHHLNKTGGVMLAHRCDRSDISEWPIGRPIRCETTKTPSKEK